MKTYTFTDLREASEHGVTLPCRVCGEPVSYADAVTSTELEDLFCSETCRDKREAEYAEYIERECARARREFKNRTPEQANRVKEWNVFADAVNARA